MAQQKKPAKKKVLKKNYFFKGIGVVAKGSEVTTELSKHPKFKDSLTE